MATYTNLSTVAAAESNGWTFINSNGGVYGEKLVTELDMPEPAMLRTAKHTSAFACLTEINGIQKNFADKASYASTDLGD